MSQTPTPAPKRFMIALTFEIPADRAASLPTLIAQEQAHIRELTQRGVVEATYVSADRSRVRLIMRGASPQDVEQALSTFPLYPFMRPVITQHMPA